MVHRSVSSASTSCASLAYSPTTLRNALALGADRAIHLKTDVVQPDPLQVARAIAAELRTEPLQSAQLLWFGRQAVDDDAAQVGPTVQVGKGTAGLAAWSPDGSRIAFTTDRGPDTDFGRLRYGNYRVALYHLANDEIEILPHQDEGKNANPVWAPDGRSLVWVSDRAETSNLYLFDLDRQELYQISDVLSGVTAITPLSPVLSWAKEDGRLLFAYFEEAGYNIYAIDDPRELPRTPVTPETDRQPPVVAAAPSDSAPPAGEAADTLLTSAAASAAGCTAAASSRSRTCWATTICCSRRTSRDRCQMRCSSVATSS